MASLKDNFEELVERVRAGRELGYEPHTPIAEGIVKFCDWYRREKGAGRLP